MHDIKMLLVSVVCGTKEKLKIILNEQDHAHRQDTEIQSLIC